MSQDTEPDDGIKFHGDTDSGGVAVEEVPVDSTGSQNETDDVAPQGDDAEEVNTASENSDTETAEVVEAEPVAEVTEDVESEEDRLKKAEHAVRVKAFETRELKRKLKELEEQNAQQPRQSPDSGNQSKDTKPTVPRMSDPDVEYDEDKYTVKLEEYHAKAATYSLRQAQQKIQNEQKQAEVRKTVEGFVDQSTRLQTDNPEYAELVNASAGIQFSDAVREVILNSEQGAELHYEVLKNPETFDRINSLSPALAARELTKIEMGLGNAPVKTVAKKKAVSTAPNPVAVSSGASAQGTDTAAGIKFHY